MTLQRGGQYVCSADAPIIDARTSHFRGGILILGLFIVQISLPRVIGSGGDVQLFLFVQGLAYASLLIGIYLVLVSRGRLVVHREFAFAYAGFLGLAILGVVGLAIGATNGYPWIDIVGDFYKFVLPAATVLGIYEWADSREVLQRIVVAAHHLYLVGLFPVLMLYFSGILEPNQRLVLIYAFPTMFVVSYWLFRAGNPLAKIGFPVMALMGVVLIYYSQSLLLLLEIIILLPLTVIYYQVRNVPRTAVLVLLVALFLGLPVAYVLLSQLSPGAFTSAGYLGSKFSALLGDHTLYERLILLGGSRAAEPGGVLNAITNNPVSLILGVGMGSTFVVTSPFPNSIWIGPDHFVHAGFWEAILRTGVVGGIAYLLMAFSYLGIGWRIRQIDRLGALVCAKATFVIVFLPVSGKLIGPEFLDYFLIAYAMITVVIQHDEPSA